MKYDVPIFAPSSEAELKATITYKDFIAMGTRFVIKKYRRAYSIFRPREDIIELKTEVQYHGNKKWRSSGSSVYR